MAADIEDIGVTKYPLPKRKVRAAWRPLALAEPPPVVRAQNAPREEAYAVCVVARLRPELQLLFFRRPAEGLLANQWHFVTTQTDAGASYRQRQKCIDEELVRRVAASPVCWPLSDVPQSLLSPRLLQGGVSVLRFPVPVTGKAGAASGGALVHVFSHVRHSMAVELMVLGGDVGSGEPGLWVGAAEVASLGLTSGVEKVGTAGRFGGTRWDGDGDRARFSRRSFGCWPSASTCRRSRPRLLQRCQPSWSSRPTTELPRAGEQGCQGSAKKAGASTAAAAPRNGKRGPKEQGAPRSAKKAARVPDAEVEAGEADRPAAASRDAAAREVIELLDDD
jgi:hypothetical protein